VKILYEEADLGEPIDKDEAMKFSIKESKTYGP